MEGSRYIISDASNKLEVEPHVLRYWEEELELQIPRNGLGHRYYREEDIIMLKNVKQLKDQGLQLKAIKMLLPTMIAKDKLPENFMQAIKIQNKAIEVSDGGNNKVKQFQEFIRNVLSESIKESNTQFKSELKKEIAGEIRYIFKEREHIEERRYKKLDETIREVQKMRQEIATASTKKMSWLRR